MAPECLSQGQVSPSPLDPEVTPLYHLCPTTVRGSVSFSWRAPASEQRDQAPGERAARRRRSLGPLLRLLDGNEYGVALPSSVPWLKSDRSRLLNPLESRIRPVRLSNVVAAGGACPECSHCAGSHELGGNPGKSKDAIYSDNLTYRTLEPKPPHWASSVSHAPTHARAAAHRN